MFNRDFSKATIARLAKRGIVVIGSTMLPDRGPLGRGSFANGEVGYTLNDNGVAIVRNFAGVISASVAPATAAEIVVDALAQ